MRRSSDRGQVEPLAALAAVLAVSAGLVVYADTLDDTVPGQPDDETPTEILDSVHRSLQTTGVSTPARLDTAMVTVPEGWQANVTLTAGGHRWQRGPSPPESADRATRRLSVRLAPKHIEPGQLRVVVWR
jgi:hypothetical protein